eukprot:336668_1
MLSSLTLFVISILWANAENVTILTQLGFITGTVENNFVVFKGIQYTEEIPIEGNRFIESVVKSSNYADTYDATFARDVCIQVLNPLVIPPETMSEDCLYLNIFSPNIINGSVVGELLPVMFWIHGGGFTYGSGSLPVYDGAGLMVSQDVVYVSINYRLGSLGYLALNSTLQQSNGRTTGSMNGVNDIIVALQYVQQYISDFGGDPSQVTVFGESAGGAAICMLNVCPYAADLFHQAIIQSGHCLGGTTRDQGLINSRNLLTREGLVDDLDALKQLNATGFLDFAVGPAADGYFLNDSYFAIYTSDIETFQFNANKLVIGTTSMDTLRTFPYYSTGAVSRGPVDESELLRYLQTYFDDSDQIDLIQNDYYPINNFSSYYYVPADDNISSEAMLWFNMNADACFICPTFYFTQLMQDSLLADHLYLFNFLGPEYPYYVPHGGEIPFVFNSSGYAKNYFGTEWSNDLSYFVSETWKNFAIYGTPNSSIYPSEWTPFAVDGNAMILRDENGEIVSNYDSMYRNGVCEFWMSAENVVVRSTFCSQSLSIVTPSDKSEGLDMWEIVLIVIGAVWIVFLLTITFYSHTK